MADKSAFEDISLIIGRELRESMKARSIPVEDIQKVVEHAESTGEKLVNPETKHYLVRFQPAGVTYWVEYAPCEEEFRVFNVQTADAAGFANIKLIIGDELKEVIERRLILVEDLQKVIEYAERTEDKLVNPRTGHFLAHFRPVSVTYWVEYAPVGDGFQVFDAYSHRMRIAEDRGKAAAGGSKSSEAWQCFKCGGPLDTGMVTITYLNNEFPVRLPKCSGCGLVFVAPDLVRGKMQEVEMALEDK